MTNSRHPEARNIPSILDILKNIGHDQIWPKDRFKFPELRYQFEANLSTLKAYLNHVETQLNDTTMWVDLLANDAWCDNFLLEAGIAARKYAGNVVILSTSVGARVSSLLEAPGPVKRKREDASEVLVSEITRAWKSKWVPPIVLLPMNTSNHWGMVFAIPDSNSHGEGGIFWGDSLNYGPTPGVLVVVRRAMNVVTRNTQYEPFCTTWSIRSMTTRHMCNNYMLDKLNYRQQDDGYSCGFYCICAAWGFAMNETISSCFPVQGYVLKNVTSEVRRVAVKTAISAVLQCKKQKGGDGLGVTVSHATVFNMIMNTRKGNVQLCTRVETRVSLRWPKESEENVRDIGVWMSELNQNGFHTGGLSETAVKRGYRYNLRVRAHCICRQRKEKCKAFFLMQRRTETGSWDISFKEKHNHGLLPPCKRSRRFKSMLADLEKLSK